MSFHFNNKRVISTLVSAVAAVVLGVTLYPVVLLLIDDKSAVNPINANQTPYTHPVGDAQQDYAKIADWHLFGKAPLATTQEKPEKVRIEAPKTRLKLKLLGVLASSSEDQSHAIIAEPGKPHKTYRVGDTLPGDAMLLTVESDRVILKRNNRHESLLLSKPKSVTRQKDTEIPMAKKIVRSLPKNPKT
ncbi:MAG: hypothetical protein GY696_08860 [Gammaproteobacteria bacterium]|nr:hypothetical protein [Gammaproteobacteria bacterium]